jgi:hypothetical protein
MKGILSRAAALAVLVGCGSRTGLLLDDGRVAGSDGPPESAGKGDDGPSSDDASSSSDSAVAQQDAGLPGPGVTCSLGTSGVQGDVGSCDVESAETCSDGMTYDVVCSCPAATCTCSQSSAQSGPSGGDARFIGCTARCGAPSIDLAYESCGFPRSSQ